MTIHRWLARAHIALIVGALLTLAACSSTTGTQSGSTTPSAQANNPTATATSATAATATATAASTLTPPTCNANFTNPTYYSTLPDAQFQTTTVYSEVPLPPLTRAYDNDASGGLRGRVLCSAGDTASVMAFMQTQLPLFSWQQVSFNSTSCTPVGNYGQPQCWKNGQFFLSLAIKSNTDWIITFHDPDL